MPRESLPSQRSPMVARVAAVVLLLVPAALAQKAGFFQMSVLCGTESRHGWAQVFAETPSGWKRFDALANIPPGNTRPVAQVWRGPFGHTLVLLSHTEKPLSTQTTYCFQPGGNLFALDHQVNTPWGWMFFLDQRFDQSIAQPASARYIDLRSGQELSDLNKLKHYKQSTKALQAPIYSQFTDMPFASLFRPLQDSEKY